MTHHVLIGRLKTVVYLDIRSKKEGYTVDILNQELGVQSGDIASSTYSNMDKHSQPLSEAQTKAPPPSDSRQVLV